MNDLSDGAGRVKRFCITDTEGFRLVDVDRVVRLEAASNYTNFLLADGSRIVTSHTLGEYEELLEEHGFCRIHQSHIVNMRHVKRYKRTNGGTVVMSDGEKLSLSRKRKDGFLGRFG